MGDTIRRPSKPSSAFVARLLGHLNAVAFTGAPQYLGVDERGRDILSYIPGRVAAFQHFTDAQIQRAGMLLREFHDATRGSHLAPWPLVVCHNDAGPNNVIFTDDVPVAFIDFDLAAPGKPIDDVGYTAWLWCVSSKSGTRSPCIQAAQVRVLADAYGCDAIERGWILETMMSCQTRNAKFWDQQREQRENPETTVREIEERIAWSLRERSFVEANRMKFTRALR